MGLQHTSYKKSNFGGAFFFLPREKREALGIIYAFCREADDLVDEGFPDAKKRLNALRLEIKSPQTPPGKELAEVIKKYNIPKHYFTDLIDGMARDLETPVRFDTFEDLKWYLHRAASVVGLMCIEVLGYTNPAARDYAVNLGYAVQLTNIARDWREDALINRIYFPQEYMKEFGVWKQDILDGRCPQELLLRVLKQAQDYYDTAAQLLPKEDFQTLLPARAMGNIYYEIFKKLQKTPCPGEGKKIKLNKAQKLIILYKTWREKP